MLLLILFAFLSGVITIFAPCIWPILPIVLSAGVGGGKQKPLGVVTGLAVSFTFFTLALASLVKVFPIDPEALRLVAVIIIAFLGVVLLVPSFGARLEGWVSRLGSFGNRFTTGRGDGFGGGFITGFALGLIWTPCAGPILAAVATFAATQAVGFQVVLLTLAYVVGVSLPLYLLTLLGSRVLGRTRALSPYTAIIQRVFGAIMILSAIVIYTGYDKKLQTVILEAFPNYGNFVYIFEKQDRVTEELGQLRNGGEEKKALPTDKTYGQAPELAGISGWINSGPLKLSELRGKVVLIDFWTYSCINCIRTLPYVTSWYDTYESDGFVVIGVHTPEFAFEQKKTNVEDAAERYHIRYPIAQDNDYATWTAYQNRYWPAHYLIDAKGTIRYVHFGEGEYAKTEAMIRTLLEEAGAKPGDMSAVEKEAEGASLGRRTPETYLGSDRGERLASLEVSSGKMQSYTLPASLRQDEYAFSGNWAIENERAITGTPARLDLRFQGEKVFLVMSPTAGDARTAQVFLDGQLVGGGQAGKDVKNGFVSVDSDRLYELIDLRGESADHMLRLEFPDGGVAAYAFTFS